MVAMTFYHQSSQVYLCCIFALPDQSLSDGHLNRGVARVAKHGVERIE